MKAAFSLDILRLIELNTRLAMMMVPVACRSEVGTWDQRSRQYHVHPSIATSERNQA
jgi:hypothetical protein